MEIIPGAVRHRGQGMEDQLKEFPKVEPGLFRAALGHYASGVTVIAGLGDTGPAGFTCQSFYSVSLDPPLVSFSVRKASKTWPEIRPSGQFAVNILSWDQLEISNGFAKPEGDRWKGIDWVPGRFGNPVIPGSLMTVECSLHAEHDAGDHIIVLGRAVEISINGEAGPASPLVYFQGRYRQLAEL